MHRQAVKAKGENLFFKVRITPYYDSHAPTEIGNVGVYTGSLQEDPI